MFNLKFFNIYASLLTPLHHLLLRSINSFHVFIGLAGILRLKDLVNSIFTRLQEQLLEGAELYGRKEHSICPCKILKVLEKGADNTCYEVGWLDKYKKVTGTSTLKAEDLIHKKPPFSRDLLKSFIRESTSQSVPWVVHDKLARKYGISTEPPEELRDKFSIRDGYLVRKEQRRKNKARQDRYYNFCL